jgi:hypothetical protein
MTKKEAVYIGIGAFFLLVFLNSSKNVQLNEVASEKPNTLSFDHNSLPSLLQPPKRLAENEPLQQNPIRKTNLNGVRFMPRFE